MRIREAHAGACFVILSALAGLYGLLVGLLLLLPGDGSFSPSRYLSVLAPFAISAVCGWAAYSLFKRRPRGALIAAIAWLVVAGVSVYFVGGYIALEARGVHSPETLLAVLILVATEFLIGLHLVQRKRDTAT